MLTYPPTLLTIRSEGVMSLHYTYYSVLTSLAFTHLTLLTIRSEGIMSLYNGFWPNFGRVVPRVTIVFIVMEQLKNNFG